MICYAEQYSYLQNHREKVAKVKLTQEIRRRHRFGKHMEQHILNDMKMHVDCELD